MMNLRNTYPHLFKHHASKIKLGSDFYYYCCIVSTISISVLSRDSAKVSHPGNTSEKRGTNNIGAALGWLTYLFFFVRNGGSTFVRKHTNILFMLELL